MKKEKLIELSERLLDLPIEMSRVQFVILEKSRNVEELSNKISNLESSIKVNINNKTDDNGKKLYSNADARDAAFNEIKESHYELNELVEEKTNVSLDIQRLRVEYDQFSNEQRNVRSLLHFFSDKIETLD
jgi:uncharacterized coiled-coil DUF342 family protein